MDLDRICVVGKFRFRLSSRNERLLEQTLESFCADSDQVTVCETIDLDSPNTFEDQPPLTDEPVSTIKRVISVAENAHHADHLFFDACCLITQNRHSVFLAGMSFAGKSTLAAGALFDMQWKLISEDVVFLDREKDQVVPLRCPVSLRPSAPALIEEATGRTVEPFRFGRWLVCYDRFDSNPVSARFSLAICLDGRAGAGPLTAVRHEPNDFLHKLIAYGNWLTVPGAPEYIQDCFRTSQCWTVSGGTIAERLRWLRAVSDSLAAEVVSGKERL
ncbi:MAG: hypothetical protein K2W95_01545 [Candidatus Obscuribacterales bacterium]|nr:hypothetical protein [Candidatus Obscuribacterales bacterium]